MGVDTKTIKYRASCVGDLIDSHSPTGYEVLSEDFEAFLDLYWEKLTEDTGVKLEITGCTLSEDDRKKLDRALKNTTFLQFSAIKSQTKSVYQKTAWFAFWLVVASVLIFLDHKGINVVLQQYLYLPFWFFGYRVLTFPVFEIVPLLRAKRKYRAFINLMEYRTDEDSFVDEFLIEDGQVALGARVSGIDDIINPSSRDQEMMLKEDMAAFLQQTILFVDTKKEVTLDLMGCDFSEKEKSDIGTAFRNYFQIQCDDAKQSIRFNNRKIISFFLALVVVSSVLIAWASLNNAAVYEMLILIFWFLGDYLFEFVIITRKILYEHMKINRALRDMRINYPTN